MVVSCVTYIVTYKVMKSIPWPHVKLGPRPFTLLLSIAALYIPLPQNVSLFSLLPFA